MNEIEQAVMREREQCALLVEDWAQDKRKTAKSMKRERAAVYEEIAAALDRVAISIRLRESSVTMNIGELKPGDKIIIHCRIATIERVVILGDDKLRIYHSRGQFDGGSDDMVQIYK